MMNEEQGARGRSEKLEVVRLQGSLGDIPGQFSDIGMTSPDGNEELREPDSFVSFYYPFKRKFGRLLLLPLLVDAEDEYMTKFNDKRRLLKSIFIHLPMFAFVAYEIHAMHGARILGDHTYEFFNAQGFSRWDFNSFVIMFVPMCLFPPALHVAFGGVAEKLNQLSEKAKNLPVPPSTLDLDAVARSVQRYALVIVAKSVIVASSFTIHYHLTFADYEPISGSFPLILVCCFFQYCYQTCCPATLASIALFLYTLKALNAGLVTLRERVNHAAISRCPYELAEIMRAGFALDDVVEIANDVFGRLLVFLFVMHSNSIVCGTFFGTTLVTGTIKRAQLSVTSFGAAAALMSLSSVILLHMLISSGEALCDSYACAKAAVQELEIVQSAILTPTDRANLRVLEERLSKPSPIRPLNTYNLNRATGASLAGLILTYVIVLLQFKSSEVAP